MSTQVVANAVSSFLSSAKGMEVQSAETTEGYVVQGRQSKDGWKTVSGMRREKPPGRQKGARLFSMLLAVCLMIAALPLSVSAAGEYVPGNPRWSGYQNQVQWDRPAGAASGDSFEYEAQLLLEIGRASCRERV